MVLESFRRFQNDSGRKLKKCAWEEKTTTKLPGSAKPNDFGANPGYSTTNLPKEQKINSIETVQLALPSWTAAGAI